MAKPSDEKPKPKTSRPKRFRRRLLQLFVAAVALPGLAGLGVQTGPGKQMVAGLVERYAVADGVTRVEVSGIHGLVPFDITIDSVLVEDSESVWLSADNLALRFSGWALLRGRLHVYEVSASQIEVARAPVFLEEPEEDPWRLPEVPKLPDFLELDSLSVERLVLGEALLGEAGEFGVTAAYRPNEDRSAQELSADIVRLDGETTAGHVRVLGSTEELEIAISVSDSVYVPKLLDVEGPVLIEAQAGGPFTEWDGEIVMELGGRRLVELAASLREDVGTGFEVSGFLELSEEIVGADVIEMVGGRFDVAVTGSLSEAGVLRLESAGVESERVRVSADGETDLEKETIRIETQVVYADASELLGAEGDGPIPISLHAGIDGEWSKPVLTIGGSLQDETAVQLIVNATLEERIVLNTTGTLTVPGVLEDLYSVPSDLGQILVELESSYDQGTGKYRIARLQLQNDSVTLIGILESRLDEQMLDASGSLFLTNSEFLNEMTEMEIAAGGRLNFDVTNGGGKNAAEVTAEVTGLRVDDVSVESVTITLDAEGQSIWENVAEGWHAALSVESGDVVFGERTLSPVNLSVDAKRDGDGVIELGAVRVTQGTAVIEVSGTIDPAFESADVEVMGNVSDVAVYAALADQEMQGQLSVTATGAYRANEEVLVSGNVETRLDGFGGLSDALDRILKKGVQLRGGYAVTEDAVSSPEFELAGADFSVNGNGSYDWSTSAAKLSANIEADAGALASTAGEVPLEGEARATVVAALHDEALDASVELRFEEGSYDGRVIEDLQLASLVSGELDALTTETTFSGLVDGQGVDGNADVNISSERVELAGVDVGAGGNRVRATGWWSADGADGDVNVALTLPELNVIGDFVEQSISGRGEGTFQVLSNEGALEIGGGVTLSDLVSGDISIKAFQLGASLKDVTESPRGVVTAVASGVRSGDVVAETLEAKADLRDVIQVALAGEGTVPGDIPWNVRLESDVDTKNSTATVRMLEGMFEEYPLKLEDAVQVSFAEKAYSVEGLRVSFGSGSLSGSGSMTGESVKAAFEWVNVPLSVAQLAGVPITSGVTGGRLEASGSMKSPSGSATISLAEVRSSQTENLRRGAGLELEASLSPTLLVISARADLSDASQLAAEASVPLLVSEETVYAVDENTAWSGTLSGGLDLADVPRLLDAPDHVLSGVLRVDGALSGTAKDPLITGSALASGASYENARMGTLLENAEIELRGTREGGELVRFSAEDGVGGVIQGSGNFRVGEEGAFQYSARLNSTEVRLVHRDDVTARATADLIIEGNEEKGSVRGEILVNEGHLIVRPSSTESVNELDVVYVNDPRFVENTEIVKVEAAPYVMGLDVRVHFDDQVFVQAQDVFTEWKGDMRIHGDTAKTLVSGELEPVRGHITFLGRRFVLDDDSLVSVNTETNSAPYLNLAATTRRTGIEATLRIRGSLEELEFSMTSNPPLPNEEILARVLFGRGVSELSPVQGLQLARAVATLSGKFEGVPFFSGPSRLPVVDTLDVTSGESGPTVSVGKYISDRVFVEAQPGNGSEESRVKVQIDATNNIALESVVGAGSQTGMGVFFKYHY